jgi:hypothetical protein
MIDEISWQQWVNLPQMSKLPSHEVERQYRIYLNEITEQRIAIHLIQEAARSQAEAMAVAASNGGGGHIVTEVVGDYIEFIADAIYNVSFEMEIEVSYDTNCIVNWGDGVIEEVSLPTGQSNLTHDFPENSDEVPVRITFTDPTAVIRLQFYNND